jgi:8-oxo-dGTP pyrophosphatase MutT (NUDIX family)
MPVEKSAGAVIFRRENNKIYYLLLHYPGASHRAEKDYWDFPKGHVENGEEEIETVKREVFEETGLKEIKFVEGFKEWIKYFFRHRGKTVFKIVTFYLAETTTKEIKTSFEHIGYKWLPYDQAIKKLTFKNAKEILKKANELLSEKLLEAKKKAVE